MTALPILLVTVLLLPSFSLVHSFSPTQWARITISTHQGMTSQRTDRNVLANLKSNKNSNRPVLFATSPANDPKNLTPETIAELIEVSFIQSCLQLASGYIDVLKLFIVAVKAGYEANMSVEVLSKLVEECPVNSAGRLLAHEEKELRREWMLVVYKMLNGLQIHDQIVDTNINSQSAEERVSRVVSAILAIRNELELEEEKSGGKQDAVAAMSSLSVDNAIRRSDLLTNLNSLCITPMEQALLKSDIRVAVLTCKVLEEEKNCYEGSSSSNTGGEIPKPPIPGTF
ncbi:hypothetical protein ACHAW6_009808 [Cyclotella cf. meneghiniana]